jgi:phospholipase/carboxylesterase
VTGVAADLATWPHLYREGSPSLPVLLLLHGTGGNEQEIATLGDLLLPGAAVLAPQGKVLEHGVRRWFRRFGEGSFDVPDVRRRATELAGFVAGAREEYGLLDRGIVAVGFSNGANIALATAMLHPETAPSVIAFSGMYPFAAEDTEVALDGMQALLLNGASDPMAPATSVDRLESRLRSLGSDVVRHVRAGSHGITDQELLEARQWLEQLTQPLAS